MGAEQTRWSRCWATIWPIMQALAYQGENNHAAVLETLDGF